MHLPHVVGPPPAHLVLGAWFGVVVRGRVLHLAWGRGVGAPVLKCRIPAPIPNHAIGRAPTGSARNDAMMTSGRFPPRRPLAPAAGAKVGFSGRFAAFTPTFATSMCTFCLPWTTCPWTYIGHNPGLRTPVPRARSAVGGGTPGTALASWLASRGHRNDYLNQYVRSPPPAPCVLSGGTPYQRHVSHVFDAFGDGFSRHIPARRPPRRASKFAPGR